MVKAKDLIEALRAVSNGKNPDETLLSHVTGLQTYRSGKKSEICILQIDYGQEFEIVITPFN